MPPKSVAIFLIDFLINKTPKMEQSLHGITSDRVESNRAARNAPITGAALLKVSGIILLALFVSSCTNHSGGKEGLPPDSTMVTPTMQKAQDSTSLTDTSYRIGDSVR